jgi:hypothetical protein
MADPGHHCSSQGMQTSGTQQGRIRLRCRRCCRRSRTGRVRDRQRGGPGRPPGVAGRAAGAGLHRPGRPEAIGAGMHARRGRLAHAAEMLRKSSVNTEQARCMSSLHQIPGATRNIPVGRLDTSVLPGDTDIVWKRCIEHPVPRTGSCRRSRTQPSDGCHLLGRWNVQDAVTSAAGG